MRSQRGAVTPCHCLQNRLSRFKKSFGEDITSDDPRETLLTLARLECFGFFPPWKLVRSVFIVRDVHLLNEEREIAASFMIFFSHSMLLNSIMLK